jgi:type IV pilus assembly protein PilB
MSFLRILSDRRRIAPKQLASLEEQLLFEPDAVEQELLKAGITEKDILDSKGEYYGVPTRNLANRDVPFNVLQLIPEESATHYKIVPLALTDGVLEVGILEPDNIEARDALTFISTKAALPYKLYLISPKDFDRVLKMYRGLTGEVGQALKQLDADFSVDEAPPGGKDGAKKAQTSVDDLVSETIVDDAPVTKIVATILRYAVEGNASDIHVEPIEGHVRVRFRVDGVLHTSLVLPAKVQASVVARIKVLSNIKLDEKRKPQDGRFSARVEGRKIDLRVSTFPSYYGEKVVMRILDPEKSARSINDIGLRTRDLDHVHEALARPYGLILISGPTGSGKSTTLYGMLQEVDREKVNVVSLEDPVEYNIEGVAQSQVMPEIEYTFASGLRSILRQDPDVIMVGEIRDKETAQLAIQAALTGHLVLSTIHTNNAIGVVPRLVDMGVDPYLIAPTLILTIAQRLVRLLCPGTGRPLPLEAAGIQALVDKQFADLPAEYRSEIPAVHEVYEPTATAECPSGTRGRIAVFETLPITREIERTILTDPTEQAIWKVARAQGMFTMKEDAIVKALEKKVPFEEINTL